MADSASGIDGASTATDVIAPGGDYNLIPYTSKPFPQSQPPRLAALATMFGLGAPDVTQCKVLELGCASGGNIIPLALRFPGSQFRGIDLTERHVREGQERIEALGLDNIRIEQGDIAALDLGGERFDFIVCHGVYSWVPPKVRDAILRISGDNLTDNGVAYVSYNVYPGWQLRGVIRDMMIYHAGTSGDPHMRVARARWVLDNIAKSTRADTPYGDMLRQEAQQLSRHDDSYILGEFLERENAPCYFRDFIAEAEAHGLVYLCESELNQCIPENIGADVGAMIRTMSRNNLIPLEQYMDFFKGRMFRQTLLVKAARLGEIQRQLSPLQVRGLHVFGQLSLAGDSGGLFEFKSPVGGTLQTPSPDVRDALQRLSEAFPATRSVAELMAGKSSRGADAQSQGTVLDAIFKLILTGQIGISTVPLRVGKIGDKPKVWPLSLLDGRSRSNWTTSAGHNEIQLDVVSAALLPFLDGKHNGAALRQKLLAAVEEGRIRLTDKATGEDLKDDALAAAAKEHVSLALSRLEAQGLLE